MSMRMAGPFGGLLMASLAMAAVEQAQREPPRPAPPPVMLVRADIVQVDAIVTDAEGHPRTDLHAADFEVKEDGRVRDITHFAYITGRTSSARDSRPPGPILATQVARASEGVMAFVVDDLSLSFESLVQVRRLLTTFVDELMPSGSLVAIIRTSAGMGALQQFTSDRRLLHRAIVAIRFTLAHRSIGAFNLPTPDAPPPASPAAGAVASAAARLAALDEKMERVRAEHSTAGTLGALHFVFQGLENLPGRKAVVLLSEGISLEDEDGFRSPLLSESLRRTIDAANRAGAVVYSIDPLGLRVGPLGARMGYYLDKMRVGLDWITRDTGGLLLADTNDLGDALGKVLDDQRGFYLLGYEPDDSAHREASEHGPGYHQIEVRVRRPGLQVRSRSGFYALARNEAGPKTPEQQLIEAVTSPFSPADLHLRLTPLFGYDPARGAHVRCLLHVDAKDLRLAAQEDGSQNARLQVLAIALDRAGESAAQVQRAVALNIPANGLDEFLRNGLIYVFDVPIPKAGPYVFKAAVREESSGLMGAASQFVDVPDASSGRLALSGIVLAGADSTAKASSPASISPATHVFARGSRVSYSLFAYNVPAGTPNRGRDLRVSAALYRDGSLVWSGPLQPLEGIQVPDTAGLAIGGVAPLAPDLPAGVYALSISVLKGAARATLAIQWADLEVVGDDGVPSL